MNCPDCDIFLDLKSQRGHSVYDCYKCGGVWIKKNEIINILSLTSRLPSPNNLFKTLNIQKDQISTRSCPDCRTKNLYVFELKSVELDYCCECSGIFFDKGELKKIAPKAKKPSPIPGVEGDEKAHTAALVVELLIYVLAGVFS